MWEAWSPVMVTPLLLSLTRSIKELHSNSRRDLDGFPRVLSPKAETVITHSEYPWLLERGTLFYKPARQGHCLLPPWQCGPQDWGSALISVKFSGSTLSCNSTTIPALHSGSLALSHSLRWHFSLDHRILSGTGLNLSCPDLHLWFSVPQLPLPSLICCLLLTPTFRLSMGHSLLFYPLTTKNFDNMFTQNC